MSNISKVPGNPATGPLAGQRITGQLKVDELAKMVDLLPVEDQVNLAGGAAAPIELPPVFEKLSPRDKNALQELPPALVKELLTNVSANVDAAKLEISNRLLNKAKALVPGEGAKFEPAEAFRVSDAAIAYQVINDMSRADRARIEGVTFNRVPASLLSAAHRGRETDGAAIMDVEKGKGVMGQLGYRLAALFEKWALTAPLGLMLKAWFPHALAEYRNRVIEIGDAQATRMKETLTHEIGHQVQFGKEMDLASINEWAKLSGWKNASGEGSVVVDENGVLRGFDTDVRPTRTNNFVYENFTEDLTPAKAREVLKDIHDPELKREFEQTLKVKQDLRGAIKEIFGVEALGYSMTDPLEDFAESYRAFYMDPELLVKKAPDKFLYINAQSRRFAPDQVQDFFARSNKDPKKVATELAGTGIAQETVDRVFKANGIAADAQALAASAGAELARGVASIPAFRQAYMLVQQKAAEKDLAFVSAFTQDPAKALGDLWGKLSAAERGQFADEGKRVELVQKMQRGQMSYVSAANQGYKDIEVAAIQQFGHKLMDDGDFRKALQQNPRQALASVAKHMPPALIKALTDPKMQASFKQFAATIDRLVAYDNIPLLGGGDMRAAFEQNLKNVNEEALTASLGVLRDDPEKMAKIFVGLEQNFLGDKGGG